MSAQEQRPSLVQFRRVKFQIANHANCFWTTTQFAELRGIGFVLRANSREGREQGLEQKPKALIPTIRAVRQPGIDEVNQLAHILGAPKKVGPDFRFDQHDGLGTNGAESPGHATAPVNRVVDFADVRRQFALQFTHARSRRRRDDNLEVGEPRFERANELRASVNFTDAHGMGPKHVTIGDGLLEFAVVIPEALAEAALPIAAPSHPHKIVRR